MGGSAGASAGSGTGGAAGAAGAIAGGGGTGGAMEVDLRPPWLPVGVYGSEADALIDAATRYSEMICRAGLCPEGPSEERIAACVRVELHNFAPSLEWLACASRTPGIVGQLAAYFARCAQGIPQSSCSLTICLEPPPSSAAENCPPYAETPRICPNGVDFVSMRCDGEASCPDGYDERNCNPEADRYDCGDGTNTTWLSVCNATPDCPNGADEALCAPQ